MSYIENNLINDESIIQKTKPHWVLFLGPAITITLGLLIHSSVGNFLAFIGLLYAIRGFILYTTSEFGITNKRVVAKFGFIKRISLEIMLSKVEGISVDQSIWGRLMGYGTIRINGMGGTREPIPYIPNPLQFRRILQERIEEIDKSIIA
ncbi:MAG: hypothetical protein K0R94_970 [Burkholderiales bacterium]|jgi:uncharacterized membrane protein YdbT with pleckstrin-like domain|nr:hypothetical protein [Burkholderiales bacterium]